MVSQLGTPVAAFDQPKRGLLWRLISRRGGAKFLNAFFRLWRKVFSQSSLSVMNRGSLSPDRDTQRNRPEGFNVRKPIF